MLYERMKRKLRREIETCKQYGFEYKKKGETVRGSVSGGIWRACFEKLSEPLTRDIQD